MFDILGKQYKGVVFRDSGVSHVRGRLEEGRIDMRYMMVALLDYPENINSIITISYYLLSDGRKECIYLLCKKRITT
jgi:hypothetical protein